jgi:hypothetical protein
VIRQMFVSTEVALSLVSRSPAEKATEAVLVMTPATVGFTTMSMVARPPQGSCRGCRSPLRQPLAALLAGGRRDVAFTLAGNVSVTNTSDAVFGPPLTTVRV